MADSDLFSTISSSDQIRANYEQFKDKFVDKDKDLISQETFLKLLIAEMSNQDPLEPTSNTEFISQLAQFSSMQYLQDSSKYSMATYASSLVGKTVSASKFDGGDLVIKTGVVEKAVFKNNTYVLTIDGEEFDISKVTSIVDGSGSSTTQTQDPLADRIARAADMVGMYAWVKTGQTNANGTDVLAQGFIESILVKDGDIKVVINGIAYSIDSIDELTFATIVDDPEDPENPDDVEGVDPDESTEPTKPSESGDKTDNTEGVDDPNKTPDDQDTGDNADGTGGVDSQAYANQLRSIINSTM